MRATDPSFPAAVAGMAAMCAGLGIGRFAYTPILPEMVAQLGLSAGQAGLIASSNYLGYLLGALAGARMARPGTARRWLVAALCANAALVAATAASGWLPWLLAVRLAGGVASAYVLVFSSAMVIAVLGQSRRERLFALHFAGVGLGILLSACLSGILIAAEADWRSHWLAAGALCAAGLAAVPLLPRGDGPATAAPAPAGRNGVGFLPLVLSYGLFGFGYVITATFLLAIVRQSPTAGALEPVFWIAVGLAAMPSVAFWDWIGRRREPLAVYAAACVVEAVGVALSAFWQTTPGLLLSALLLGGTFVGITATGLRAAPRLAPGEPGRALALMTAAFGLGQIVGPVAAGIVHDMTGTLAPATIAAVLALLAAAWLGLRAGSATASRLTPPLHGG